MMAETQSGTRRTGESSVFHKWNRVANSALLHQNDGNTRSSSSFGTFSWKDVALNKIPPKKSDDLCKMLLAESDRMSYPQMNPAQCFMSKYNLVESQELLVSSISHWLLTGMDFTKSPNIPISGLVQDLHLPWDVDRVVLLTPCHLTEVSSSELESCAFLTDKDVHQIVRELVVGLYVFNQIPELTLEANYDRSTAVHLQPAYQDTSIGQALVEVDYMMKSLWHGAHMPHDKRHKFNSCWRSRLNVNSEGEAKTKRSILVDFLHAGLEDVTEIDGYGEIYDCVPQEYLEPSKEVPSNSFSINMCFYVDGAHQMNATFMTRSNFVVTGKFKKMNGSESGAEDAKEQLRIVAETIQRKITQNVALRVSVEKLKIVATLLPLLFGLKSCQKIPNLAYLVPPILRKDMVTERELPPLMVSSQFKNRWFHEESNYFGLHGGVQFDFETPCLKPLPSAFQKALRQFLLTYKTVEEDESGTVEEENLSKDGQPMSTMTVGSEKFYVLEMRVEKYVAKKCHKPFWANQLYEEMSRLKFKSLPLTTTQLHNQFRIFMGPNSPPACNNVEQSLHVSAARGMVASFHALLRELQTNQFEVQNADGWSLMHTASLNNNVYILGQLIQLGLNVNTRQFMYNTRTGPTPLHLAARCGANQAVSCLLSCHADVWARDNIGWAAIHYAASCNQMSVVRLLLLKYDQMELTTDDELVRTPLLLCAVVGGLETLKWLIKNGCRVDALDARHRNVIHLATLHCKIHVLKFLISRCRSDIKVWKTLSKMMNNSNIEWQVSAIKCIGVLSSVPDYVDDVIQAGLPGQLVSLMREHPKRQCEIVATLSTMSYHEEVLKALVQVKPLKILIKLLSTASEESCSRTASIIGDIASAELTKNLVGEHGGIESLSNLLTSSNTSLLLNVLKALSALCCKHDQNKNLISEGSVILSIVNLLSLENDDDVRLLACVALSTMAEDHTTNQTLIIEAGALQALRHVLLERKPVLQKGAVNVLRVLAHGNPLNQSKMLELDVFQPTVAMLKGLDLELKEAAASALWAMAGSGTSQRKFVAHQVGNIQMINMLMTKSEAIICICCPLVSAVVYEDVEKQNNFLHEGGLGPLMRLVNCDSSAKILKAVMETLSTLCLGVDHGGNKSVQTALAKQDILESLVQLLCLIDMEVQVAVLLLLACLSLNHQENRRDLVERSVNLEEIFKDLLEEHNSGEIRLCAAKALALFAYKDSKWIGIKNHITLDMKFFDKFLHSSNEWHQCFAAYEIALLGSIVKHRDVATCISIGIELLVTKLNSGEEDIFILAASLLCSLTRGHAGIADALTVLGLVELMLGKLASVDRGSCVQSKCAGTLACLSFYQMPRRKMMSSCRRRPELYDALLKNLPKKVTLCKEFVQDFEVERKKGLPSERLTRRKI